MDREAIIQLLGHYRDTFRAAWHDRHRLAPVPRLPVESDFLPPALALQETPVSPAPRVLIWILVTATAVACLWAFFGKIDVVATAPGKIVESGRSKTIQSPETATVRAILVSDGQRVRLGQSLIELDATAADADLRRVQGDLSAVELEAWREKAFLLALDGARFIPPPETETVSAEKVRRENLLLEGQLAEYRARLSRLDAEIARRQGELAATVETVRKLEKTAPIARQRAEDLKSLVDRNFISKHGYLEREQTRIEQESDLATQRSRQQELAASVREAQGQLLSLKAETKRVALDSARAAEEKAAALREELIKAQKRAALLTLSSPVDGKIQQLSIHTVGGVVSPTQPLLVVVPDQRSLEIEAAVENKDIGFIYPGQSAEVKIDTFPFTRYGTVAGEVLSVSDDAVSDEKRGLFFPARVNLSRTEIDVDGKQIALSPGMAVSVEIKTGKRRAIDYLLSPLLQYQQSSFRER